MEKNLYIDASHPNETRVVLKSDGNIEDYEYEGVKNSLIKNNIYLGKVSRVEPSLQAAFIDFGRDRHGFLSFNDIQSDYYQLPQSDLDKIKEEEKVAREELLKESEKLAVFIQAALKKELPKTRNRGIKQAGFHVLVGATMPNVLVEVGFVTNKQEARMLSSAQYKREISKGIFESILDFKNKYERK